MERHSRHLSAASAHADSYVSIENESDKGRVPAVRFGRIPSFFRQFALALLTGLFLFFGWPNHGIPVFLLIAFIPLLLALEEVSRFKTSHPFLKSVFLVFTAFAVWFSLSGYWLSTISFRMFALSTLLNTLNYTIPLVLFSVIYKRSGSLYAVLYFVAAVVLAEWLAQYSSFATPYFMLGYGFSEYPAFIQTYRFWGIEGGTLWILMCNALIYLTVRHWRSGMWKRLTWVIAVICFPVVVSLILFSLEVERGTKTANVVVHHSGKDPHSSGAYTDPVNRADELFNESFASAWNDPSLVVWPETVLMGMGWLHAIDEGEVVGHLKNRLQKYPETTLVLGGIGFSEAVGEQKTSRYTTFVADQSRDYYYNTHNLSFALRNDRRTVVRSKELFVPFQERIPCLDEFPWLENAVEKVGLNAMFSLSSVPNRPFYDRNGEEYQSLLCYESIYPQYVTAHTENAGAILVQANEYWIQSDYGARQYFITTVPIAVQLGKYVLRSSNGGVSAIINPKGKIIRKYTGRTDGNLTASVELIYNRTLYASVAGYSYVLAVAALAIIFYQTMFNTKKIKP